ncbi:metallophosphoesterase [Blautia liquoris]|uniref:Phosphoesterase n=1 Tax=Blautia liquoris TaxID=2779518 RepID=A0A7M2RI58_9FIRM|nr:metallophosphoesterase [Blautia liquoris]QOV20005.1 metallophosphoesterase [Blautia liquoris]
MKILIVSDTHGQAENLLRVLDRQGPVDCLIHCGDIEGQENYFRTLTDGPCYMVAGNSDWGTDLRRELEFSLDDYRVYLTHGNQFGVSLGTKQLRDEAKSRNMQFAMFGHTHRPLIEDADHLVLMNPGSLSYPRQLGRKPSYIVMEIDKNHEAHYQIRYLD